MMNVNIRIAKKSVLLIAFGALVVSFGSPRDTLAQTEYFFRDPRSEMVEGDPFTLPAPPGPDGDYYVDGNWFSPGLVLRFVPDFSIVDGEIARIENGGTAFVSSDGGISPGQIVIGSATGTSGALEVQNNGVLEARIGNLTNGNITVGSGGGTGTLRVLPGGTLTAEGPIVLGSGSSNSIQVGDLSGTGTATLMGSGASLPSNLQMFPNADFSVTGGANFSPSSNFTSEVTGNDTNGTFSIGGTATLSGTLNLNFNSYNPSAGHTWRILEAGTLNGNFDTITSNATVASNENFVVTRPVEDDRTGYQVTLQEVLVLEVNRNTGQTTVKHPGGSSILLDGYFVGSDVGSLSPGNRVSVNGQSSLGNDWFDTEATEFNVGELKPTNDGMIPGGDVANVSLGTIFNAVAGPFGQDNEDLEFRYRRSSDGAQIPGRVQYVGDRFNTLILQVDPSGSGDAYIRNNSNKTAIIDSYEVLSEAGRLTTSGWDSFDEQNFEGSDTWLELASNANQVGEVNQTGFTSIGPGAILNLGALYLGGTQDLEFNFLQMDDTEGIGTAGIVLYEAFEAIQGDYNGNGVVDAADYTIWRDHLGQTVTLAGERPDATTPGEVDQEDYDFWVARFGATTNPGAASLSVGNVPEPASWLLATVAGVALVRRRMGRRGR